MSDYNSSVSIQHRTFAIDRLGTVAEVPVVDWQLGRNDLNGNAVFAQPDVEPNPGPNDQ